MCTSILIFLCLSSILTFALAANEGCVLVPSTTNIETTNSSQRKILSNLKNKKLYSKSFTYKGENNIDFTFVICGPTESKDGDAAIVRIDRTAGDSEDISLGSRKKTNAYGNSDATMMSFGMGGKGTFTSECKNTSLSSIVMIVCDVEKPKGQFSFMYYDPVYCQYGFELKTSAICDHLPGISGWTIFFIILIVGFVVYFTAGFLYLRFRIQARGLDQIPNRLFWIGIGNKLADGCGAVCRCDRFCSDQNYDNTDDFSSGYSPIGETNQPPFRSQPASNDSALLQP